jgi:hypothetical protein
METTTDKLINVVLAGQPELAGRLNKSGLRQLKQRISLWCELKPLSLQETAAYIGGRLRIAGGTPAGIFTRAAVATIYQGSSGVPRTVNVICDNALIGGFAAQVRPVSRGIVDEVLHDFDLPTRRRPLMPLKPVAGGIVEEVLHDFDLPAGRSLPDAVPRDLQGIGREAEKVVPSPGAAAKAGSSAAASNRKFERVVPSPGAAAEAGRGAAASGRMFEMFNRKKRFSFFKTDRG